MTKKRNTTSDTALIEELLTIMRYHFHSTYIGYDIWINRKNLAEHIHEVCLEDTKNKEKYNCIQAILNEG